MLHRLLASIGLLLILAPAARALEVRWALVDGAPYHLDGAQGRARSVEELGDGLVDRLIRGVAAHGQVQGLTHRLLPMSRSRLWRAMQAGEPLCYANALRTPEHLRWAHFTPAMPPVARVLVTRKGQLGNVAEVSLAQVLARPDLRGGFETGRSYGAVLDDLIRRAGPQARSQPLPDGLQLLRMLDAGRMDYLIHSPLALQYLQEQLQPRLDLQTYALTEERDPQATFIACTRGAWGDQVVRALDQALRRWAADPDAARTVMRWLPPGAARRESARVEAFFRERSQASQVE